jgi:hypothetical protein
MRTTQTQRMSCPILLGVSLTDLNMLGCDPGMQQIPSSVLLSLPALHVDSGVPLVGMKRKHSAVGAAVETAVAMAQMAEGKSDKDEKSSLPAAQSDNTV